MSSGEPRTIQAVREAVDQAVALTAPVGRMVLDLGRLGLRPVASSPCRRRSAVASLSGRAVAGPAIWSAGGR
jgi:hypothetical protein